MVTNSLNTANILAANPHIEIVVAGGTLRRTDGDLLDFDLEEVHATKTIMRQSKFAFVVADHSKVLRSAPGKIGNLAEVSALFTDAPLPEALAETAAPLETDIVLCST